MSGGSTGRVREEPSLRYWQIAPGEDGRLWADFQKNSIVGIGYDLLDLDLAGKRKDELFQIFREKYPHFSELEARSHTNIIWNFLTLRPGDRFVAASRISGPLALGIVKGNYRYDPQRPECKHIMDVEYSRVGTQGISIPVDLRGKFDRTITPLTREEFEALEGSFPREVSPGPPFAFESFHLLADLHANPSRSFYQQYHEEFEKFVERPFQDLFREVVGGLSASITGLMETEKGIFASIPKNDFGKGRAWSFYWGALYPRNGQRLKDAQLFLWINRERLEFGFHIGEFGSDQRKRFVKNCQKYLEGLINLLKESLTSDPWKFGINDEFLGGESNRKMVARNLGWKEWLKNLEEVGIQVSMILDNTEVLQNSRSQLRDRIKKAFEELFPLVLLAVFDDPLPMMIEYLETGAKCPDQSPEYGLAHCARETGFEEQMLARWVQAIDRKGQAILYGPPGTGKTYLAEKLSRHLIGGSDGFYEIVQFHPAYTYEDFMRGADGRARNEALSGDSGVPGRFFDFCSRAANRKGRCVFLIDEINRAHLPRVFGELTYLLEYRDRSIFLPRGGTLSIPANVRVIGTMNTADRSAALADYGLRRRFAFLPLYPNYEILRKYHGKNGFVPEGLIGVLQALNQKIGDPNYGVGITFFLREDLKNQIEDIWRMEIEPYLQEYFHDRRETAGDFSWEQVRSKIFP